MAIEPIHIRQTARPTRYAFAVGSGQESLLKAVSINTVLWGGIYNPIIPLDAKEDRWLGLLKEFDPDYIVNLYGNEIPAAIRAQFEERIVIEANLVVQDDRTNERLLGIGVDILPLLEHIHEKELGLSGEESRVAIVEAEAGGEWIPYAAASFGNFSSLPETSIDYAQSFERALRATRRKFDPDDCLIELVDSVSPIKMTGYGLRLLGGFGSFSSHIVYVGDHRNLDDLVEFWNIRATGREVWFVPVINHEMHAEPVKKIMAAGRYAINPRVENEPDMQKGFGASEDSFKRVCEWISGLGAGIAPRRFWQAHWGRETDLYIGDIHVAKLESKSGDEFSLLHEDRMTPIKLIEPEFLEQDRRSNLRYRWAIELGFSGVHWSNDWLLHLPRAPQVERLLQRSVVMVPGEVRIGRSGIVLMPDFPREVFYPAPIKTHKVFEALFEGAGLKIELSPPGRYANEIIRKMGSLQFGCRVFKLRGVRDVINRLSNGSTLTKGNIRDIVMSVEPDSHGQNWRQDLYEGLIVRQGQRDRLPDFGSILHILLEKKIVRPGFTLKCKNCYKSDWYHVSEFSEEFTCRYCFEQQSVDFSSKAEWQFKSDGLFQLKDSAHGSLAVILALWRLDMVGRMRTTRYLTSVELKDGGCNCEIDFTHLRMSTFGTEYDIVLGEAKGFKELPETEVGRMRELSDRFQRKPFLAFATLKESFSDNEKELLLSLVEDSYKVIALTRFELDPYELYDRFESAPVKHAISLGDLSTNTIELNVRS